MFSKRDVEILEGKMSKNGICVYQFIQLTEKQDELVVCTGNIERRYKYANILEIKIVATEPSQPTISALQRDPYPAGLCTVIVDKIRVTTHYRNAMELTIKSKE